MFGYGYLCVANVILFSVTYPKKVYGGTALRVDKVRDSTFPGGWGVYFPIRAKK